jgi:hypothetical protein
MLGSRGRPVVVVDVWDSEVCQLGHGGWGSVAGILHTSILKSGKLPRMLVDPSMRRRSNECFRSLCLKARRL